MKTSHQDVKKVNSNSQRDTGCSFIGSLSSLSEDGRRKTNRIASVLIVRCSVSFQSRLSFVLRLTMWLSFIVHFFQKQRTGATLQY